KLYVRAFDRGHVLRLVKAGVNFQIRELFESALVFGREVLIGLGFEESEADDAIADVRKRDAERLDLQIAGGITAGRYLMRGNLQTPQPEPLVRPRQPGQVIGEAPAAEPGEEPQSESS